MDFLVIEAGENILLVILINVKWYVLICSLKSNAQN